MIENKKQYVYIVKFKSMFSDNVLTCHTTKKDANATMRFFKKDASIDVEYYVSKHVLYTN